MNNWEMTERDAQKHIGLTFLNGYNMASEEELYKNPPFFPGFFVLKMSINETNVIQGVSIWILDRNHSVT